MPVFFVIDGVKIFFYYEDHNPPHFHAIIAEYEALVEINSSSIMIGDLPKNKRQKILDWCRFNKDELLQIWNTLNK